MQGIDALAPVRHGLLMGVLAMILGALWAVYLAVGHESLHGGFEAQVAARMQADMDMSSMSMPEPAPDSHDASMPHAHGGAAHAHGGGQHSHSGDLARDAMQRLLRGHIHFMGLGLLAVLLLVVTAFTSLRAVWKRMLGWTFGLGALLYPPAWILMGFRTVQLGPEGAEASVLWLFGPAVALLVGSMAAVFLTLLLETGGLSRKPALARVFERTD